VPALAPALGRADVQTFSRGEVLWLKLGCAGLIVAVCAALFGWRTIIAPRPAIGAPVEQVVPFSHKHHAGDDGIDCRYCHSSVETESFAGLPALATCMTCHSQLFTNAPLLQPLRSSFAGVGSLRWNRIHHLPDFAYFDHSIHLSKGIGCSTCHGPVDAMPLTYRVASLRMEWCLDCHREPERNLRPPAAVFDMHWQAPPDQLERGRRLRVSYQLHSTEVLTACSTCHR
jgi:hypothetical protein